MKKQIFTMALAGCMLVGGVVYAYSVDNTCSINSSTAFGTTELSGGSDTITLNLAVFEDNVFDGQAPQVGPTDTNYSEISYSFDRYQGTHTYYASCDHYVGQTEYANDQSLPITITY